MSDTPKEIDGVPGKGDTGVPEKVNPLLSRRELLRKGAQRTFAGMAVGFLGLGMVGNSQKKAEASCICSCCTGCTGGCFGCTSCTWICSTCTGCTGSCSGCQGCSAVCQQCEMGCSEGLCNMTCGINTCDQGGGPGYGSNTKPEPSCASREVRGATSSQNTKRA